MTTARLKLATREVWRYDGSPMPAWVRNCTEVHRDGRYLVRRSGKQLILPGEYLIRDLDDVDPEWMTADEFNLTYETVA